MTKKELKTGKTYTFKSEKDILECGFSEKLNKFGLWFNGKLETYKTFYAFRKNVEILIIKYNLEC